MCLIILCDKSLISNFPNQQLSKSSSIQQRIWGIHSGKLHCKCNEKFHHGVFNRILKTYRSTSISEISKYIFYNATRGVKMVQTPAFWVTKELGPRTNQQQIIQSFLQQHRLNTWHGYLTIKDHSRCTKAQESFMVESWLQSSHFYFLIEFILVCIDSGAPLA